MIELNINKVTQRENYFKKKFPEHYAAVLSQPGDSWQEKFYLYINQTSPHKCPICGKITKFIGYWKGYNEYCSSACANKANAEKISDTKLERYGSSGYNNRAQAKRTCLEKYGTESHMQCESIKSKFRKPKSPLHKLKISQVYWSKPQDVREQIKNKRLQTFVERYGIKNPMDNLDWREKAANTYIERYGGSLGQIGLTAAQEGIKRKTQQTYPEFIDYVGEGSWLCSCPHPDTCNQCTDKQYITDPEIHRGRLKYNSELCTRLLPVGQKNEGTTIELYIRSMLDEACVLHEDNRYDVVYPKSLDLYLPEHNVAIECNGVYWHSSLFKRAKAHYEKYKMCEAKGIQLLTIWEDWIVSKPEIVKSLILNKIGKTQNRIFARKCVIKELDYRTSSDFLEKNHIQGKCKSRVRLGLIYNDQLVSVMCFNSRSKLSGSKQVSSGEWELIRFCNILNTSVVGGASKLLKYFIKEYSPTKVVSFSSNDISTGNLYKALGFEKEAESVGYWYVTADGNYNRYHRSTFTKDNIIKMGLAPDSDKTKWTETEVMSSLPFYRIYDSGTTRWTMEIPSKNNIIREIDN